MRISGEDEISQQVSDLLDRMEELWSASDTLYVVITFRVLRLCFGSKFSLQLLNEQMLHALRRRNTEDINYIVQVKCRASGEVWAMHVGDSHRGGHPFPGGWFRLGGPHL